MKKALTSIFVILLLFTACSASEGEISDNSNVLSKTESTETESTINDGSILPNESNADFSNEESSNVDESIGEESEIDTSDDNTENTNEDFMKAVWISQFDMAGILKENGAQRDKESFESLYSRVLNNIKNDGYNTVIVQVRPYADSFYPSELFPVSNYVSGAFGVENIYDPFEIIVSLCKEIGLSVHAWLNPMRGMKVNEIVNIPDKYPIKQWYNDPEKRGYYIVEVGDRFYLNPAYEEVRALIASGAKEVCENYEIDGVHIDDYFYPTKEELFDKSAFDQYISNGGKNTLKKFRHEMLDLMVSEMYRSIKSVDEKLLFGISPAGNIENTYNDLYTDVYKWCSEEGYIDYICPQIYFGLEHQTHDFIKVYNIWNGIIKNNKVKIFAGLTLGKAKSGVDNYAGVGKNEWANNKDVLKRCLEYIATRNECGGIVVFCYQHMYDPITGQSVKETEEERNNMKNALNVLG